MLLLLPMATASGEKFHVCELQLQLRTLADTREEVHKLYKSVRERIPKMFKIKDAEKIKDVGEIIKKVRACLDGRVEGGYDVRCSCVCSLWFS